MPDSGLFITTANDSSSGVRGVRNGPIYITYECDGLSFTQLSAHNPSRPQQQWQWKSERFTNFHFKSIVANPSHDICRY